MKLNPVSTFSGKGQVVNIRRRLITIKK